MQLQFANVYSKGKTIIKAAPLNFIEVQAAHGGGISIVGDVRRVINQACYEHRIASPDYAVFQTQEAALAEAAKLG